MGEFMETAVASYIGSSDYTNLPGDRIKKTLLKSKINHFRNLARKSVLEGELDVTTEAGRVRRFKAMYTGLNSDIRGSIKDIYYQHSKGRNFDEDLTSEGGEQLYEWAMATRENFGSKLDTKAPFN